MRISRPNPACCWLAGLGAAIVLSLILAGSASSLQSPEDSENITWSAGALGFYHGFASRQMRDTYGSMSGFRGTIIIWPRTWNRCGLRGDISLCGGISAEAEVLDSSWTVTQRKLNPSAVELSSTVLCLLLEPNVPHRVVPYFGVGGGAIFGFDQLSFGMSREGVYYKGQTHVVFRPAFEAHAVLGASIPVTTHFALAGEMQWIQAGDAGLEEVGDLSIEDRVARDLVYSVLGYPDMNFTGWRVLAGAQYSWGK